MKKLLFLIIPVLLLSACKEDKTPVPYSIFVEETNITLVAEGETYYNRYYAYSPELKFNAPEEEWLDVKMEDSRFVITVGRNEALSSRRGSFSIEGADNIVIRVNVTQTGRPTRELQVVNAKASSEQAGETLENALQDDSSLWHSDWNVKDPSYTAIFEFREGMKELNIIEITPRTVGTNGHWGQVDIWVLGDITGEIDPAASDDFTWGGKIGERDADGYVLMMKLDFEKSGDQRSILLPNPVVNPQKVKFHIDGGTSVNGFASMQYIRFVQLVG